MKLKENEIKLVCPSHPRDMFSCLQLYIYFCIDTMFLKVTTKLEREFTNRFIHQSTTTHEMGVCLFFFGIIGCTINQSSML